MGSAVGYRIRFHDRVSSQSRVKLLTDGMLLAEIQQDRYLNEYDTLIIDEAHERSLNIDFLLGYLQQLLSKRPDLRLIITSATIDPERFSKQFNSAPIINVSGRTFPVEVRYRPPAEEGGSERDDPMQQAIIDAVDELSRIDRGDILIFLSGEREIRETAENLRKHRLELTEILPLYARLGPAEQARIFQSSGRRHIVLATNVAETSLTVPGIHYVIDTGYARISRYSHRSKIQRLPVERISQASAAQRKGRCGRIAAGICIRLYSEEDFESRLPFTEPEILRTNLASVILQMKILGFGEIESFPFLDPPESRQIKDGYRVLEEVGAVDGERYVTRLGRQLGRLPLDPRIGRMLLAAAHSHCLDELLVIAAALSVQDPRDRPMDRQQAADEAHHQFIDETSDFIGYLKLWTHLRTQRRHLSKRKFRLFCREHFLSWTRVQEWRDIHHQLRGQMHEMGYKENSVEAGFEEIHKSILTGLLSNIGFKGSGKEFEYLGARNSRFRIFPGSGLFGKQPKWVMAAELVETSRLYARILAAIRPEWIESVAGHLIKHGYSEPHWEKKRGQVAGFERVTLFGLTLVPRRKINYGPINPTEAREIFIRFALVGGDFETRAPFWRHNRLLSETIEQLQHKSRRFDLLVDEDVIYAYYDKRIAEGIYSKPQFEQWLRKATRSNPKLLHMRQNDLLREKLQESTESLFPDTLRIDGMQLPLKYNFDPGGKGDGVTLKIPQTVLNQISEEQCEWLVPGLLRERSIALIRALPKQLRKSFVPVPEYVDACLKQIAPSEKSLTRALAEQLKMMTGVHISEDAWRQDALPDYLRMNFHLQDDKGRRIDAGRDLQALKKRHGGQGYEQFHSHKATGIERRGLKDWDFGALPETVEVNRGGIILQGFPALIDNSESVDLRVLDSKVNAARTTRAGVRRLFILRLAKDIRYLRRNLNGLDKLKLQYAKAARAPEGLATTAKRGLEYELIAFIVDLTFIEGMPALRNGKQFNQRIETCKARLVSMSNEALALLSMILDQYQTVRKALSNATQINWIASISDMQQQLDRLLFQGFLLYTPYAQLKHYPRYLQAIEMRLGKLAHAAARDRQLLHEIQAYYQQWQTLDKRYREAGKNDERVEELRWRFEELRVSLFAQELRTAYPISLKRLEKRWKELGF